MAEQIREWLTTFSNQTVQIWCEDPETTTVPGVITKSYLTYRILMKQFGRDIVGIRHRYSEFEALRTILKDKYAPYGILIPSLPPKNSVASLIVSKSGDKDIFIKERTLGLTMFCEVRTTVVVFVFLWLSFYRVLLLLLGSEMILTGRAS